MSGEPHESWFTDNQRFWVEVYNRFELDEPVTDPKQRAARQYTPRQEIVSDLRKTYGRRKPGFLLMGTVGTGKTTELFAMAEDVVSSHFVVFLDLWRHFDVAVGDLAALQHIEPWEVLLLVGLAIYGAGESHPNHVWKSQERSDLERAIQAFYPKVGGPSVDISKLAGSLVAWVGTAAVAGATGGASGAGLALLSAAAGSAKWELPLGRRPREGSITDQDKRLEALLKSVNALLKSLQQQQRSVALFIDGLDRIAEARTIRDIFIESRVLAELGCAMVLTAPIALRQEGMLHMSYGLEPRVLANVPVLDRKDPKSPGNGVEFMRDIFNRRVADLPAPPGLTAPIEAIPLPLLDALAYYSGGRARDFIRLIKRVADKAVEADVAVVDRGLIDMCIDEVRRFFESGVTSEDVELLHGVVRDPRHLLPGGERVTNLLNRWLLLPYPNESEWYFPHPLLTRNLVPLE